MVELSLFQTVRAITNKDTCKFGQGVEKTIISKMLVEGSNRRTLPIARHAGVVRLASCLAASLLQWRQQPITRGGCDMRYPTT